MRPPLIIVALLVGSVGISPARAQGRYVLDTIPAKNDDDLTRMSLRDTRTGQILWTWRDYEPVAIWSKDRRAVAIEGVKGLRVWREGQKLRLFNIPGQRDYLMGCVWSPDKQHILVRCGSSGAGDMNIGSLFCLRVGRGKDYYLSTVSYSVRAMKWRDNKTAFYRWVDDTDPDHPIISRWTRWRIR